MKEYKEYLDKYQDYLVPLLCLMTGIVIGMLLSPCKKGFSIALLSHNKAGSDNKYGRNSRVACSNQTLDEKVVKGKKEKGEKA